MSHVCVHIDTSDYPRNAHLQVAKLLRMLADDVERDGLPVDTSALMAPEELAAVYSPANVVADDDPADPAGDRRIGRFARGRYLPDGRIALAAVLSFYE